MKRAFDMLFSLFFLILCSPVFLFFIILIWLEDRASPFYIAPRVAMNGKLFYLIKFRSMIKNADKTGVDSTSANDMRITRVGQFIRRHKIDELPNFVNILIGDMSFVGPRPNVEREVQIYSDEEKKLLRVRPGVTDFASIVFADEGEILEDSKDPDIDYNQLIRPWKSRLGLVYVAQHNILIDMTLIFLTLLNMIDRSKALDKIHKMLLKYNVSKEVLDVVLRQGPLVPTPPPGFDEIVTTRQPST